MKKVGIITGIVISKREVHGYFLSLSMRGKNTAGTRTEQPVRTTGETQLTHKQQQVQIIRVMKSKLNKAASWEPSKQSRAVFPVFAFAFAFV